MCETFPLYVWYHGGGEARTTYSRLSLAELSFPSGWVFGSIHMNDYQLRRLAVDHQVTVVNVEYRYVIIYLALVCTDTSVQISPGASLPHSPQGCLCCFEMGKNIHT